MSALKNSYIRFLNCIEVLESKTGAKKLDALEGQLLNNIMLAHAQGREMLVGNLLVMSNLGSQATLHGRIKRLRAAGYIRLVADDIDGRKKKVVPTKMAIKHYEDLSKLLTKVATT